MTWDVGSPATLASFPGPSDPRHRSFNDLDCTRHGIGSLFRVAGTQSPPFRLLRPRPPRGVFIFTVEVAAWDPGEQVSGSHGETALANELKLAWLRRRELW